MFFSSLLFSVMLDAISSPCCILVGTSSSTYSSKLFIEPPLTIVGIFEDLLDLNITISTLVLSLDVFSVGNAFGVSVSSGLVNLPLLPRYFISGVYAIIDIILFSGLLIWQDYFLLLLSSINSS